ncbi:hypothetical protein BD289DRAFT_448195 [Coniella lustricola]|uniref:Uncharacterized protein n=1 Tax=Coniella lustricola TaxID=2025994 RepID=A0A2T2ZSF3_9PEZI|nr:hypothetical protein BD289DRAFT_448195 [Coniella lustricola]
MLRSQERSLHIKVVDEYINQLHIFDKNMYNEILHKTKGNLLLPEWTQYFSQRKAKVPFNMKPEALASPATWQSFVTARDQRAAAQRVVQLLERHDLQRASAMVTELRKRMLRLEQTLIGNNQRLEMEMRRQAEDALEDNQMANLVHQYHAALIAGHVPFQNVFGHDGVNAGNSILQ